MALDRLDVELTVVLGICKLPLHRLLSLGRGGVIRLETGGDDIVDVLANGLPVAQGKVTVEDGGIKVEVQELVRKTEVTRAAGSTIGDRFRLAALG